MNTTDSQPFSTASSPPTHRAEAVHRLYLGIKSVVPFMPLLPMLLVVGMWSRLTAGVALAWLAASVCMPLVQIQLSRHYFRAPPRPEDAWRWGRYVTWTALVDGIVWGVGGILFYFPDDAPRQLLLLALIIGIPAGSIFSTSWWPATQYANAGSMVGLTAIGLIARGNTGEVVMGIALLLYLVILHYIMQQAHGTAMETIALRFEKEALIEQLSHEKDIAERANLAKSKFLAAASHDLRQPLHAMSLFVAAMSERKQATENEVMLANVQRCTTALESLLQTLLDISKIDAGTIEPQLRDFRLAPLLRRMEAEFSIQATAVGLAIVTDCADVAVRSDPDLVERILRNLLANAIRYTPAGRVELHCRQEAAGVIIEVRDTGIGIPPEQQQRIFDEFVQLGNPERDRTKGLGLGLAIVRRLSVMLDLPLTLESTPGQGSTFRIVLPAGNRETADQSPVVTGGATSSLDGLKIAVIDDEADVRAGMQTLLEGWGCRVFAAEDAQAVIAALTAAGTCPDIIVADYRLRDNTTGVDAISAMMNHFGAAIPAAIITGDTAPERLIEARASGYQLLHKPLRPAKLRVLLQNLWRGTIA